MSEFDFLETNITVIRKMMKADYEEVFGKTLYEGSPEALLTDWLAYWIWYYNVRHNILTRQTLKQYAHDDNLDAVIGCIDGIERIQQTAARVKLRFYVKKNKKQIVPAGTLVTPDGVLYFKTEKTITVQYFEENTLDGTKVINYADTEGVCMSLGLMGNGISENSEMSFSGLENIERVISVEESNGGTDRESDEKYYARSLEESKRYSTAGPLDAYEYLAKKADARIIDARAYEGEGTVSIKIIVEDGADGEALAKKAEYYINNGNAKPQGDLAIVSICEEISYDIAVNYRISEENSARAEEIRLSMLAAVNDFARETGAKIGTALNPTKLRSMLYLAGAEHVEMTSPSQYTQTDCRFKFSGNCVMTQI